MIPVDQTTFGHPGGNCFSACVASVLELPIEAVPYFMAPEDWFPPFLEWLAKHSCYAVMFKANGWEPPRDALVILSGQSPRGPHCVVGRGVTMIHDPHPSRAGIGPTEDYTLLLPFDPARRSA